MAGKNGTPEPVDRHVEEWMHILLASFEQDPKELAEVASTGPGRRDLMALHQTVVESEQPAAKARWAGALVEASQIVPTGAKFTWVLQLGPWLRQLRSDAPPPPPSGDVGDLGDDNLALMGGDS